MSLDGRAWDVLKGNVIYTTEFSWKIQYGVMLHAFFPLYRPHSLSHEGVSSEQVYPGLCKLCLHFKVPSIEEMFSPMY